MVLEDQESLSSSSAAAAESAAAVEEGTTAPSATEQMAATATVAVAGEEDKAAAAAALSDDGGVENTKAKAKAWTVDGENLEKVYTTQLRYIQRYKMTIMYVSCQGLSGKTSFCLLYIKCFMCRYVRFRFV